jgi:hypothetical protein
MKLFSLSPARAPQYAAAATARQSLGPPNLPLLRAAVVGDGQNFWVASISE